MGFLRDIGAPGIIVILLAALIIFGPKRLPELGQAIAKTIVEFKKAMSDMTNDDKKDEQK